jgi:hypothetical protein
MTRLREILAHGGIAMLAVVFSLAFAGFDIARAIAQVAVFTVSQHVGSGFGPLQFHLWGTSFEYGTSLQGLVAALFLLAGMYGIWQLTRRSVRICPECRSEIPREASVCRYCTVELNESPP